MQIPFRAFIAVWIYAPDVFIGFLLHDYSSLFVLPLKRNINYFEVQETSGLLFFKRFSYTLFAIDSTFCNYQVRESYQRKNRAAFFLITDCAPLQTDAPLCFKISKCVVHSPCHSSARRSSVIVQIVDSFNHASDICGLSPKATYTILPARGVLRWQVPQIPSQPLNTANVDETSS